MNSTYSKKVDINETSIITVWNVNGKTDELNIFHCTNSMNFRLLLAEIMHTCVLWQSLCKEVFRQLIIGCCGVPQSVTARVIFGTIFRARNKGKKWTQDTLFCLSCPPGLTAFSKWTSTLPTLQLLSTFPCTTQQFWDYGDVINITSNFFFLHKWGSMVTWTGLTGQPVQSNTLPQSAASHEETVGETGPSGYNINLIDGQRFIEETWNEVRQEPVYVPSCC